MALLLERLRAIERGASVLAVRDWTARRRAFGPLDVGLEKATRRIQYGDVRGRCWRPAMK